ncbi:MAG: hypothetical protein JWO08_1995 [Verrucomicrobiaceae bacterium]|nr:hypothetical protein [Verrucomicrobiaceae bacterium]
MKEQLTGVPIVSVLWLVQRKACERRNVVKESLRCGKANRIPTDIANILNAKCMNVP